MSFKTKLYLSKHIYQKPNMEIYRFCKNVGVYRKLLGLHIYIIKKKERNPKKKYVLIYLRLTRDVSKTNFTTLLHPDTKYQNGSNLIRRHFIETYHQVFDSKQSFACDLRYSFLLSSTILGNLLHFWAVLKHVVPTWSNLTKHDQTWSNMIKMD